ncbi:MAG: hypothetical protein IKK03_03620 [Lachnospiraceae bacterium]|nr:hypothetical protein [Lachnospiraceae bacterium]
MKTYKLNKFVRTLAVLLVGVFTITNVCTVPIFAQTEDVVTYAAKDDFESYNEWPTDYAFTGNGVKNLAKKDNNQYLKLEAPVSKTPTLSYAFTQAYTKNDTTPLWIELSLCGAGPEEETFSEWYLRGRVSSGSDKDKILSGAGNVVSCGETELARLSSDSFTKFIIKVEGKGTNFSYSVWVGEYSEEPAATGSLTTIADFGKINLNSNKPVDKEQYLGFDNFAVYASNEYQDVFKQESEPSQESSEPSQESSEPSQESSEPSQESSEPSQESSEPSQESSDPSQESSEPSQEPSEPSQESSEPTQPINPTVGTILYKNDFNDSTATFENGYSVSTAVKTDGGSITNVDAGYLEFKDNGGSGAFYFQIAFNNAISISPVWAEMDVAIGTTGPDTIALQASGADSKPTTNLFYADKAQAMGADKTTKLVTFGEEFVKLTFKLDLEKMKYTAYVGGVEKYNGDLTFSNNTLKRLRIYIDAAASEQDDVLKIDNFQVFSETIIPDSGSSTTVAPDKEMDHPELTDFTSGIAVMAGQTDAYVNGEKITLSSAAELAVEGKDVLVPGSFIRTYLGVNEINDNEMYSLATAATSAGKTATWDSRGVLFVTDSNVTVNEKLKTLITGYLATGETVSNYSVVPNFTQSVIDDAVALEPAGWLSGTGNYEPAEKCAAALYYLTLATKFDPDIKATDGTLCKDAALKQLRYLIKGGNEPFASVGAFWGHAIVASDLLLIKNTPEIYNELTDDEKDRMDWLMKGLAIAGNWGFNDLNNYGTGFDLKGNFGKAWNPNYVNTYLSVVLNAAMYFENEEKSLDEIFTSFDYDAYIDKYTELGFTNILTTWTAKDLNGVCISEAMENGGTVYLIDYDGVSGHYAGGPAGTGAGVKVAFKYKGKGLDDLIGIFNECLDWTYSFAVINEWNKGSNEFPHCYIISGKESPYTGQMGMLREYAATKGRSRTTYCYDSYEILNTVYANMKMFGGWDSSTKKMREFDNRIYVGNEDLIFKMEQGYRGFSNGSSYDEYEEKFLGKGANYQKDVWRNFHCMLNESITIQSASNSSSQIPDAEPKDGITQAPEGAFKAGLVYNKTYYPEESWYSIGKNMTEGSVEFDIVVGSNVTQTKYDCCIMLDKKAEDTTYQHSNMLIQINNTRISIRDGNMYRETGLRFAANYRFHVKMDFDMQAKKYTVAINQIYPEVGEVVIAENYDFRTNAREIDFVDAIAVVKGNEESNLWVENFRIVGDEPSEPSEPDELTYVAQIGDDKYETLQEAIKAAHDALTNPTTGAVEIVLCAHVTSSEDIIINSGVTLDLNGKTLTASSLATFGGNVVDSSEDKNGVLKVDSTKCTFATTNKQMPVYNGTDGYVFADITKQEKHSIAEEGDSAIFNLIFRPFFGLETSIQNALLVDGNGIDDQFSVIIRLTWKDGTQDLIFKDEMVQAVYGSDKAFYINASGVTSFEGLTITPMVVSDTLGVTWSGSSFTDFSATGYTVTE